MADTLEQLLGQVNAFKSGSDQATQQVISALGAMQDLSNANAATYTQAATDNATVTTAKQAAEYETQLARVKAANIAGANLNSTTEVLSSLSAAAADAQKRKDEALAAIQEKDSVSFIDNPLQYIINQFTVNQDIAKHNIANQQLESAHNRILEVNAESQTTIATQNAISEPLTAASMEASARLAAAQATIQARDAQIQGLNYGTKGIEFALNAKKDVIALGFQANNALNAERSYKLSLENLELSKKEFAFRQQEWAERQADKALQLQYGQSVIDKINLGRKLLSNGTLAPIDDLTGKMVLSALKGKGTLSTELQTYLDAGERATITGKASIGATPAAAATAMQTVPVQITPVQQPIKNILTQAASDTSNALKSVEVPGQNQNPVFSGLDKKDKNSINAAYNGRAQQILDSYSKEIKPGDSENPYQIASINQLAAKSPTIQSLPLYKKVLKPLVDTGVQLSDPKQIMSIVGNAVAQGTISHKEALDLTTIYHVGVTANIAMRNFGGFGLVPKNSYNAKVETDPTAWRTNEVIDLTKPDDVSMALMKLQAARLRRQFGQGDDLNNSSLFQPNPQAAAKLESAVNNIGNSVDSFFNNLPHK